MTSTHGTATDRDGGDTADGTNAIVGQTGDIAGDPRGLYADLIAHGVPLILCTPHKHRSKCQKDCDRELDQPTGWMQAAPAMSIIDAYHPGHHTVAMVTGHVLDAIDVDTKNGATIKAEIERATSCGVVILGIDITPSGGAHLFVPSSGIGTSAKPANGVDFRGGLPDGTSRGLIYLPGSSRPKYPGKDYKVLVPIDWQRLAEVAG